MNNHQTEILIIDDSPTVRRLSELILSKHGFTVHTADNGETGLDVARKVKPAVILVDYLMPKMNGHRFCQILRSDPLMRETPVILISSKGESVGEAFEQQHGVIHSFTKPFDPEELIAKLNEVLASTKKTDQASSCGCPLPPPPVDMAQTMEAFGDHFEKILRRYIQKEFPVQIKNIFTDTLYQTGLAKKDNLVFSGSLEHVALPEIVSFLYNAQLTGRLTIFSSSMFGEIFVERGNFVFANLSRKGGSHRFMTDLLLADERLPIDKKDVSRLVATTRDKNTSIGQVLVEQGLLTEKDMMTVLRRHAQDAFNAILDAKEGNFFLEKEPLPPNLQDISFRVPLIHVLMEGLRHQDERQQACIAFSDETLVPMRLITNEDALNSYDFSEHELKVFSLIDGRKNLRQIIRETHLDAADTRWICYSLSRVGLLRVQTPAGT